MVEEVFKVVGCHGRTLSCLVLLGSLNSLQEPGKEETHFRTLTELEALWKRIKLLIKTSEMDL